MSTSSSGFTALGLAPSLLNTLAAAGYAQPTEIQAQAIPHVLTGADLLGIAQTGTGKTAAFALPILQRLASQRRAPAPRSARVLVLAPTRELASQIAASFRRYGAQSGVRVAVMFGGVPKPKQARAIAAGVDVLVACPGRLLDHMADRAVNLEHTEILVLDEADHMLDLGFIVPLRRIAATLPRTRQTLLFSATMPEEIAKLARDFLRNPVNVSVAPVATTAERIDQQVMFVPTAEKRARVAQLLRDQRITRGLVFMRTKHGAEKLVRHLTESGLNVAAIHGDKSQSQRERALAAFKSGATPILIATDIAARGIDVTGVSHVINFDLPNVPESYVHRIGRTARAGRAGVAISLCDASERAFLRAIEKLTRTRLSVIDQAA